MLRDLLANPFRLTTAIDPGWLHWQNGRIPPLAQAIYTERRFADLPLRADMLTDAGCTDADILGHCRSGGEHVRGC